MRERFDLDRFETVYAYGDTPEDREMLSLAQRKYYRWKEIDQAPSASLAARFRR